MTAFTDYFDALASSTGSASSTQSQGLWQVSRRVQHLLLVATDFVGLGLSTLLAFQARDALVTDTIASPGSVMLALGAIVVGWLALIQMFGGYHLRHQRAGATEFKRVFLASFATAGLVGISSYLLKADFPRGLYILLFTAGTACLVVTRLARRQLMHAVHRRGALLTPIIVAGERGHVDAIAKVLRRETWLGYRVVGALTSDRTSHTPAGLPVLGSIDETVSVMGERDIATVIFAEGAFASPADFRRMAWELEERDVQMIVVPALTDISARRLDVRPVAGLPLVDVDRPQAIEAARWIKRTWDAVGSAVLLLLAAPVMGLVALAIKLEDGGPVLFRQTRVGLKGENFECLKFRSMSVDAEERLEALIAENEGAGPLFKLTHDPRITKVGRFIRRFSLDELPQFWNSLRGDMSLVGPRPALPTEVAQYDSDTRRRLDVRPGLTGLWQVSGRSNLPWDETVRLDLYYVDNWSIVQDLIILAKTAKAVVGSSGAY
jgi:exopolysaccharide biosynthesis polyprenyl glycosylphosphotransferase